MDGKFQKEECKEDVAIVLDFLPHGYPFDTRPLYRKTPIVQAIGKQHFTLLELIPKRGVVLQPNEEVYVGEGKRDKIHHISGRISAKKLTETAKGELEYVIAKLVEKDEKRFIEFFNSAGAISTRMHQIELLSGIGKKHMWEIIEQREEKPFESLQDLKNRIKQIPDLKKLIVQRIIDEINEKDKYRIFVK
ncbi:DUF655 domain-containing protein [archaeon]|nr:DUF655 domain-containing protein [archaeon]